MNQVSRNAALWIFLMVMFLLLYGMFGKQQINRNEIDYSEFRDAIERGEVENIEIKENEISGFFKEGFGPAGNDKFVSFPPPNDTRLVEVLRLSLIHI